MTEQDLLKLKKQIDDAKNEVNQLQGRKKYLEQQLKDNWNCKDLDAAKKKVKTLKSEVQELEEKIEEGVEKLQEKYDFE